MADRKGYQPISDSYGSQKFSKNLDMFIERHLMAVLWAFGGYLAGYAILFFFFAHGDGLMMQFKILFKIIYYMLIGLISTWLPDFRIPIDGVDTTTLGAYKYAVNELGLWRAAKRYLTLGIFAIPFGVFTYIVMIKIFKGYARDAEKLKHLDGAALKTEEDINNIIETKHKEQPKRGHVKTLPVGEVSLTRCNEVYGCLIVGAPGSGKTVAISNMLDELQKMPDYRVVAYTPKGDFISKYYDEKRGDIILNPFDLRSLNLNIFDFIKEQTDYQRIAAVLIPEQSGSQDPFWTTAARNCFSAILNYCYMTGKRTNHELWDVLCWTQKDILDKVAVCPGSEEITKYYSDSKLASNVSAVVSAYTSIFKYLPKTEPDQFNMHDWLENKNGAGGWIFISNHDELKDILKPWITLFIDFLVAAHLSMPDDRNRRVVYVLDEVNTLHSSVGDTIYKLAITGRSKGAVLLLGAQGCTGLEKTLGKERAADVYNAVSNSIFLRVGTDDNTAKWMSSVIGDTMFYETELSDNYKVGEAADGGSGRKIRQKERLVMESVFHEMESLIAYVRLTEYGFCKTTFTPKDRPDLTEGFIKRPDLGLSKEVIFKSEDEDKPEEAKPKIEKITIDF